MEQENTFTQLYAFTQSKDSDLYKNAKIVLDSIKEALQKKGMFEDKTIATALFASLFQLLQQDINANNIQNEEPKLLLFNQLLTKVNMAIVIKFYEQIREMVFKVFEQQGRTQLTQKFAIAILVELLQTQQTIDQNNVALNKLIENIINEQVAARKQAWKGLNTLLSQKITSKFMMGTAVTKFVLDILQSSQDDQTCIIITQYLSNSIQHLPINNVNDISFALLKRLQLTTDQNLEVLIYLQFENIMKLRQLSFDNCETLIKEFIDNQPSLHSDQKVVMSYSQCLIQTLILMHEQNIHAAKKFIPTVISVLQEIILSDDVKLATFGQKQMETLIIAVVGEYLWKKNKTGGLLNEFDFTEIDNLGVDSSTTDNTFEKIISMLQHMLSNRFDYRQIQVHGVLGVFFQKIDQDCLKDVDCIVKELVENRVNRHASSFEKCMAKLISKIGAGLIVKRFPLQIAGLNPLAEDFEDKSSLWMIPMFLKYTKNQSIEDFLEHIVPHISTIKNGMDVNSQKMNAQELVMFNVFLQLWECFSRFHIVSGEKGFTALNLILDNLDPELKDTNPHFGSILRGLEYSFKFISHAKNIPADTTVRAQKLIKSMHTLLIPGKPISKQILAVIQQAAFIAPKEYLNSAFAHNIKRLVTTSTEEKTRVKLNNSVKTFDMILAVSQSMDFKNDRWEMAMKFIKCFLDDQTVLQKKAYKFLSNIVSKVHYTFLPQVSEILKTKQATQSSARPIRLQVITQIWQLNKFDSEEAQVDSIGEFIQTFLPELIVGLRESNTRSRKASQELFKKIAQKMLNLNMLNDFISMISAGLGASSSLMKADSIVSIGYLLEKFGKNVDTTFIKEVNSIILLLLKEQNKEIFKAVLVYLKKYMRIISKSELKTELPDIFNNIFESEQVIRDKHRSLIKQIVSRLIRKFTRTVVEDFVPEAHKRIVRGILKEERYQKNKKIRERNEKKKLAAQAKQVKYQETDFDVQQRMESENLAKQKEEKNLLLKFDQDNQQFHFVPNTGLKKMKEKLNEENERKEVEYIKGKIIVREAIEDMTGKKRRREDKYATYDSIVQEERDINDNEKTITSRKLTQKRTDNKNSLVHNIKESGDTFKAKGETGGDVVRKGKPDPYAFIQLNPKALNKRHQKRASKAFDVIMNKKEDGALKGLKTSNKKVKQ
ncbi:hypothetical protein ABPG74_015248 [Tetrahymena malaccensis]